MSNIKEWGSTHIIDSSPYGRGMYRMSPDVVPNSSYIGLMQGDGHLTFNTATSLCMQQAIEHELGAMAGFNLKQRKKKDRMRPSTRNRLVRGLSSTSSAATLDQKRAAAHDEQLRARKTELKKELARKARAGQFRASRMKQTPSVAHTQIFSARSNLKESQSSTNRSMKEAREEHQHRTISKVSRKVAVPPSLLPTKQPSARKEAVEQMVWSLDASGNAYQASPAQLAKKKLQNIRPFGLNQESEARLKKIAWSTSLSNQVPH
jgi:hypothetical protein